MTLQRFQFSKNFNEHNCDYCGICFHKCPVLELPLEEAKEEIKSLVEQGKSKTVLRKCTSCMACNHYCPNNCNPHTLILNCWNERYLDKGLPARSKLVLPYHFPNLYTIYKKKLPEDEKNFIEKWENNWKNPPKNNLIMFYTGCNLLLQPYLLNSKLFNEIPIFGSPELCCGEPLYRMGCLDAAEQVGYYLQKQFNKIGFKKLIMGCLAGYHLLKEVYEKVYDIKFDFEVISFIDWLEEELNTGKYKITKLDLKAVIHDNCWPKASGDIFFNKVREILKKIGIDIIEPEHTRENALCCGIGAAAANYSIIYAFKSAKKRIKEFKKTEADLIINYCGGCNWYFSTVQSYSRKWMPIYHLFELVEMAIGEKILHKTKRRGKKIIRTMIKKILFNYLKRKRHRIKNIMHLPVPREKEEKTIQK